ncbi:hypothetical protein HOY80DRAFT_1081610 [Tuber brumale]|nr:hypothetical protein HOY80DRAFT_1081610 [Tuber brumale]
MPGLPVSRNQRCDRLAHLLPSDDDFDHPLLLQLHNLWFERYHKCAMEGIALGKANVVLTMELMDQYTKNMELKGEFTIRGALVAERIVYQAKMQKKIQYADGIQEGLNKIAELPGFFTILMQLVGDHRVALHNIQSSIKNLFREVLAHQHPPSSHGTIVIRKAEYSANEYAALIAFLKMQDTWHPSLCWREAPLPGSILERQQHHHSP